VRPPLPGNLLAALDPSPCPPERGFPPLKKQKTARTPMGTEPFLPYSHPKKPMDGKKATRQLLLLTYRHCNV
ncbi:MAG: hypothetical protein MR861_07460, partial [Clostridiales bacterium]|nr:hypothetical protein [Clostridiales bacterium]